MESAEIARRFLDYFSQRGHTRGALGQPGRRGPDAAAGQRRHGAVQAVLPRPAAPPFPRATSVQKCVRTPDIDEVGKTTRHATFFQMLGNFSFGDYFKEQAIPLAWELLTSAGVRRRVRLPGEPAVGDRLPRRRRGLRDLARRRRRARGAGSSAAGWPDNYWHMGVPGPGGPCSEIYYDRGPEYGREGGPEADEDRYLEVWNLVFMQDQLSAVRSKMDFDIRASCRRATSTPAWAWSGWRRCCRASTTSTRSTPCGRCSTGPPS